MARNSYLEQLTKEIEFYVERDGEVGYELLYRLEKLEKFMEKEKISPKDLLNYPSIISLYSLRDEEDNLKNFFTKTNFLESVKSLRQEIRDSKTNLTDLQVEQISAFIKYDALEEDKKIFSDYVLSQVMRGNHRFSYETLKKAFINVIDGVLDNLAPGKYCEVVDGLKNSQGEVLAGQKTASGVKINENQIRWLYNDGNCEAIETAFHEVFHIYQEVRLKRLAGKRSPEDIIQICGDEFFPTLDIIKEMIIGESGIGANQYYHDNYDVAPQEKEANIRAKMALIGYLDELHLLTPLTKEEIEEEIADEKWKQEQKLRIYGERKAEVDDLVLSSQDTLFRVSIEYPILHMVYTCDENGIFRSKTQEELLSDYNGLKEHTSQINRVYAQLIKNARSESRSDSPTR